MDLKSDLELRTTREKLELLEGMYEKAKARPVENATTRRLTLDSLKRLINQLTEEIVRYESRAMASQSK